jgi:hypothetical protein|tara:strand:+ start:358 stop:918 length:561 start_codon:yes stop_codon:yes gene_type:complete
MPDFTDNIPDEYLNDEYDFGFTTVDENEYNTYVDGQSNDESTPITSIDTEELSADISSLLEQRFGALEDKVAAMINALDPSQDFSDIIDVQRIEDKLDKILQMENNELLLAVSDQSESIRAVIDEVEERKGQLNEQYTQKLKDIEKMILPLLVHLTKDPDKEYIKWPNRAAVCREQVNRILAVTRS